MLQTEESTSNKRRRDGLIEFVRFYLDQFFGSSEQIKSLADCFKRSPQERRTLEGYILYWHFNWRWYWFIRKKQSAIAWKYLGWKHFLIRHIRKLQIYEQRLMLAICEKTLGPNDPFVATRLQKLAQSYYKPTAEWLRPSNEEFAKAELLLKRSLAIREIVLEPNDKDVDRSLLRLGECLTTQGRYGIDKWQQAEQLYKRLLARREKALGRKVQIAFYLPNDLVIAWSLHRIAQCYSEQKQKGKLVDQEQLLRGSLAIREMVLGPNHPDVCWTLAALGCCLKCQGKHEEAQPFFERYDATKSMEKASRSRPKDLINKFFGATR